MSKEQGKILYETRENLFCRTENEEVRAEYGPFRKISG